MTPPRFLPEPAASPSYPQALTADQILALASPSGAGFVPASRRVLAGTGLSGGGDLSGDITLSLAADPSEVFVDVLCAAVAVNWTTGDAEVDAAVLEGRALGLAAMLGQIPVPNHAGDAWYNPTAGSDENDGLTKSAPKKTFAQLQADSSNPSVIVPGAWVDRMGNDAGLATVPTDAEKRAWMLELLRFNRFPTGTWVRIDTTDGVAFQITGQLVMPAGTALRSQSAGVQALLEVNLPVADTWTATGTTNVWVSTKTVYQQFTAGSFLYFVQNGVQAQLTPMIAPDLATAKTYVSAQEGGFWPDPSTGLMYYHPIGGLNPNTSGVPLMYAPVLLNGDGQLIVVDRASAWDLSLNGGCIYLPTVGDVGAQELIASGWDDLSAWVNLTGSRAGKHTFGASYGNGQVGLLAAIGCTATLGPGPQALHGGTFSGSWSHFVDFSGGSGNGSAASFYVGCQVVDGVSLLNAVGGSNTLYAMGSYLTHNAGGDWQFALRELIGCRFPGGSTVMSRETVEAHVIGCMLDLLAATYNTVVVTGTHLGAYGSSPIAILTAGVTATLSGCLITPGNYAGTLSPLSGTVKFVNCTIDMTLATNTRGIYATSWQRDAAINPNTSAVFPLDLEISDSIMLLTNNLGNTGLVNGVNETTDAVLLHQTVIQGGTQYTFMPGTADYATYASAAAAGVIVACPFVNSAGLDANYVPVVSSPAIGLPSLSTIGRAAGAFDAPTGLRSPYQIVTVTDRSGRAVVRTEAAITGLLGLASGVAVRGTNNYDGTYTVTPISANTFSLDGLSLGASASLAGPLAPEFSLGGRWYPAVVGPPPDPVPSLAALFIADANSERVFQDTAFGVPAVNDGDPVLRWIDVRDTPSSISHMYMSFTNAVLRIVNGKKRVEWNGTTTTGLGSTDLALTASPASVFIAVTPIGSPADFAPAVVTQRGSGGMRLCLKTNAAQWGTAGLSGVYNSGTTLTPGVNYVLGMAMDATQSGLFYTNGSADGSFTNSVGLSSSPSWIPQFGDQPGIEAKMQLSGLIIAGNEFDAGKATTADAYLLATQ